MRWPEFLEWTTEERRAVLAVLLFTGGGGLLLELGRRFPDWTPDLLLVSSLDRHRIHADSTGSGDSLDAPGGVASRDTGLVMAGLTGTVVMAPGVDVEAAPPHRKVTKPKGSVGPVDINRADATLLATLPGVGPKLAERILLDRAENGPYRSLSDLDRVKGVGPAMLQKLFGLVITGITSDSTSTR